MVKCAAGGGIGTEGRQFPSPISFDEETLLSWADSYFRPWLQGLFLFSRPRNQSKARPSHAFLPIVRSKQTRRRDKSSGMLFAANGFQGGTSGKSPEVLLSSVVITLAPTSTTLGGYRRGRQFFRQIGSSCLEIARTVIACGGLMRIAAACGDRNPYGPS